MQEAYDIIELQENEADGAILKKLYRIHSRYKLELNDELVVKPV